MTLHPGIQLNSAGKVGAGREAGRGDSGQGRTEWGQIGSCSRTDRQRHPLPYPKSLLGITLGFLDLCQHIAGVDLGSLIGHGRA